MNPAFSGALERLFAEAPEHVRAELRVKSEFRSPETQERLWANALKKYGSPEASREWVAPPGRSRHNHGYAADLEFLSDATKQYIHQNAKRYGLTFPMSWEPWHIELVGAR